uniref:Polyketide synthase n=1 Tax=Peronospora matthiolae TaxID=2874970 RepID=A0AAV1VI42_9STRA
MHPSAISLLAALSPRYVGSALTAAIVEETAVDLTFQGRWPPTGIQHHETSLGSLQGVSDNSEERAFSGADAALRLLGEIGERGRPLHANFVAASLKTVDGAPYLMS